MKQLKSIIFLLFTVFLSGCSYGYDVLIVNDSNKTIEVRYKITENGQFYAPTVKLVDDLNEEKSLTRFWTEEKPWQKLPESLFSTILGERRITVLPRQVVKIEHGNYNPISEQQGDLTDIIELKIISQDGVIHYKGKLLLNQFQKDGYTYTKTFRDEFKD